MENLNEPLTLSLSLSSFLPTAAKKNRRQEVLTAQLAFFTAPLLRILQSCERGAVF